MSGLCCSPTYGNTVASSYKCDKRASIRKIKMYRSLILLQYFAGWVYLYVCKQPIVCLLGRQHKRSWPRTDWLVARGCYSLSVRHSTWWGIFTSWVGGDRSWLSHTGCLDVWVEDIWTDVQNTLRIYWNSGNIMVLFLFMSLSIEIRCCYRTSVPASQRFRELRILVVKSQWGDHLPRVAFYPL